MMEIRDYKSDDAAAINDLAVKAFSEYSDQYDSWQDFSDRLRNFSSNASYIQSNKKLNPTTHEDRPRF